jgi:hypothetical protein
MMGIYWPAAANQARMLGHKSDMVAVADPAEFGEGEYALVDLAGTGFGLSLSPPRRSVHVASPERVASNSQGFQLARKGLL